MKALLWFCDYYRLLAISLAVLALAVLIAALVAGHFYPPWCWSGVALCALSYATFGLGKLIFG